MIELAEDKIYRFTDYLQTNLPQEAWPVIAQQIPAYVLKEPSNSDNSKNLHYVGFYINSIDAVKKYNEKVYQPYLNARINTPPRGNLSSNNDIVVLGIKPGSWQAHLSPVESSWIFGPSSKMLHKLLRVFNLYPYFTNVYKSHYDENNMQLQSIYNELLVLAGIYKLYYQKNELNVICLGSYPEYLSLATKFREEAKLQKLNMKLNFYKIWHPSYLLRAYTVENFNLWQNNLQNILNKSATIL